MATHISSLKVNANWYKLIVYPLRRPGVFAALTAAELDVAGAILEGASTRELARRRRVSERTIANQLAQIYRKVGVCSRHELVALSFGARESVAGSCVSEPE